MHRSPLKNLLLICVVPTLAGCGASKREPATLNPVNGSCGIRQDTCKLGTPSETGDTAPPYKWTCSGRHGGKTDFCSVPITGMEEGEVFAGQNELEEKVKAAGPLRGKLVLLDWTIDSDNPRHAYHVRNDVLDMGVPGENLAIVGEEDATLFLSKEKWRGLREETLVAGVPTTWVATGVKPGDPELIARHNILFVTAAINTHWADSPDLWYPEHSHWKENPRNWERSFAAFATGKVIMATYADLTRGEIVRYNGTVKCGLAKEFCYSVMRPSHRSYGGSLGQGTSSASSQLAALAFYLSQLWDTPSAVVNTLNVCAEDVGEPGVDEVFGRGVVSVVCDRVRNRERSVVSSSISSSTRGNASPILAQMTAGSHSAGSFSTVPQSFSASALPQPSAAWFRPFYAFRGRDVGTITGHLGGRFSLKETDFLVSGGADYAPWGVYSSLLHTTRTPFVEFGTKRNLFSSDRHTVFLLGVYGYSDGDGLSAHALHLGTLYERLFGFGTLSLYADYQQVRGSVGIPGYREADVEPVPFVSGNPEVRISFSLGL